MSAKTVYLHIGTMKSGTTYLQDVMKSNKELLAERGVLWPGRHWGDQVYAARDLANINPHDYRPSIVAGSWQRLVDEIHAWDGHAAVISMEWLAGGAQPDHIRHAVETLAPAEVHVILTGRDLARNIPATWQEDMQNWMTCSWQDFIAAVRDPESAPIDAGKRVWRQQDLGAILRKWNEVIPAERTHVITVPPPGADPGALWERFAAVIGIKPDEYSPPPRGVNTSLGVTSAELMRRVNTLSHKRGMKWRKSERLFKQILSKQVLSQRKGKEPALVLPDEHWPWAIEQGKRIAAEVEQTGARVWGDLAELVPDRAHAREGATPDQATDSELLEAALDGIVGLVAHVQNKIPTLDQQQEMENRRHNQAQQGEAPRNHQEPASQIVKRCLVELAQRGGVMGALYRFWQTGRRKLRGTTRS
ncbi:hypothetical protein GCM10025762_07480 [Haloechinothrix salitolerans]